MSKRIIVVLFGLFSFFLLTPAVSNAEETTNVSAKIDFPYYRSVKKVTRDVQPGGSAGWQDIEKRTDEKVGRSAFFNFIVDNTVPNLPPFNNLFASEKSSTRLETLNSAEFIDTYHIIGCKTDHTYKLFAYPLDNGDDKVDAKLRTVCKKTRGYPNNDTGTQVVSGPPSIDLSKSRGEFKISKVSSESKVTYTSKQESKAVLTLVTPPENLCKRYARYLVNRCAKGAVSNLLPGGFLISESGVVTKITDELEDLIFKTNPIWTVPVKVTANVLTPRINDDYELVFDEKPVPCSGIKVLGNKLNSDCTTKVSIREKQALKDITPNVSSAKYYNFNVEIIGAPVIDRTRALANIFSLFTAAAYQVDEGKVNLDKEGFMIVPGDDIEYLPLSLYNDEEPEVIPPVPVTNQSNLQPPVIVPPSRSIPPTTVTPQTPVTPVTPTRTPAPVINSVLPLGAKAGDTVTLYGSNFTGVISDLISISDSRGSISPEVMYSSSASSVTFKMPNLPAGTYYVELTANSGTSNRIALNALQSTVQISTPYISSVSPSSAKSNTLITLTGTNFEGVTSDLLFIENSTGSSNLDIVSSSATSVTFRVPNVPAGAYKIYLFADKGESNWVDFTVQSGVSLMQGITHTASMYVWWMLMFSL